MRSEPGPTPHLRWIYAALYLVAGAGSIYCVWNSTELAGGSSSMLILVLIVGIHLAFGFAIGSWWALLLPFALVLLAVPAGYPPTDAREPLPIWFAQIYVGIGEAVLMVPGIVVRRLRDEMNLGRRELS